MMYYGNGMGAGGWILMVVLTLGVLALLTVAVLAAARPGGQPQPPHEPPTTARAEQLLADRFAHGDIDPEEYEQRLRILRDARR